MANSVVGLGLATPPVQLSNTVNAISQKYIVPVLGDNVFKPSPVFWALTREGKKFGAGELIFPEINQEELPGGAYYGDQLLDTSVVDSIQPANQQWRPYRQPIVIPITDIILNRGGAGNLDIIKAKYQVASASFLTKLSRALWHTTPQNTTNDIDDIDSWAGATTNVIAGIDRSAAANAFWQPAANVSNGSGVLTPTNAETAYQTVVFGYDEPDLMTISQQRYAGFKGAFTTEIRFGQGMQDEEALQVGFRNHFLFNNAIVVPDLFEQAAQPNTAYFLNSKYVFPCFHEADYFNVDPFIKPTNQRVLVSTLYLTFQLSCISPRMLVKLTNITA
jgi:hypothetical protein